jgi:hypothetical protein
MEVHNMTAVRSNPALDALRRHVTGAIEAGRAEAIVGIPACENHPNRVADGVTGNGQPMCATCLVAEFEHAWLHVPEAFEDMTRAEAIAVYMAECSARLADEVRP